MSTCSPWATIADVCEPCNASGFDKAVLHSALQMASDILFDLTRRRWPGVCSDKVRPCRRGEGCLNLAQLGAAWDAQMGGSIVGAGAGLFQSGRPVCGCGTIRQLQLQSPVVAITEVLIDGAVVNPAFYRVDDRKFLTALDDQVWPVCQRMELPDSELNTWSVSYTFGAEPPIGGRIAAASLGCQLALACNPTAVESGACRLPKRVTTITRQGVTLAVLDPLTLFSDGLTGLPEVDLWVMAANRGPRSRRANVLVPDQAPRFRRTGTPGS